MNQLRYGVNWMSNHLLLRREKGMNARITRKSGMAFSALGDSNNRSAPDAATAHGGNGTGVVPMEMILMGWVDALRWM